MKKTPIGLILLIAAAGWAPAEDFSLEAYLARMEKYSKDLSLARQDTVSADLAVKQARSALFPTVAAQAAYGRNFIDVEKPTAVAADANHPIDSGIYPLVYQDVDSNYDNEVSAGLVANQSLFNMKALAALKYGKEYSSLTKTVYEETERTITTTAKKVYYQGILLKEILKVKESAERNEFETYDNMRKRYEAGMAQELEVLRAEVNWKNKIPEVTQARKNSEIALVNLKTLAGMDLDAPVTLTGSFDTFPDPPKAIAMDSILSSRTDYETLLRQRKLAELSVDLAKADFYPTVSASLSYMHQAYGNEMKSDYDFDVLQLGVKIALPVYTGGARLSQIQSEKINLEKSETRLGKKRDEIQAEIRRLNLSLQEARERIESARTVLETAEKAYKVARVSLANGLATQLELNESSVQLEQAGLSYVSAVYEYLSLYFDWEKASGR